MGKLDNNESNITEAPKKLENIMHCREGLLLKSLCRFYDNNAHLAKFLESVNGNNDISLRLLDWLITNYAKKYNVTYLVNGNTFNIYLNYKTQLKAYSKKQFDPFQRRDRISFGIIQDGISKNIITTIGQLNFFRWAIQNKVMDYAAENYASIEKDMNASIKSRKKDSTTPGRKNIATIITSNSDTLKF